jgi:ribosomal protein L37AE/L43A
VRSCALCDADMIAPKCSEYVSEHCVRNVWLCEACGCEFEDKVYLSAQAVESVRN